MKNTPHKKLNDVKEMDIRKLPRTGKVIWQAFLDAKNYKLPED